MSKTTQKPFDAIYRRWTKDVYETKASEIPDIVYHYTDAAGLIGMLASGLVWATDYRFLNDKAELQHTTAIAKGIIADRISNESHQDIKRFHEQVLYLQNQGREQVTFVFAVSEEKDDLSQWRGYSKDGEGFTIGFCGRTLYYTGEPAGAEFAFCKIEYNQAKLGDTLSRSLSDIEGKLRNELQSGKLSPDKLIKEAAETYDVMINDRSVFNKHKSFSGENEWRTMSLVNEKRSPTGEVKVRPSGNRLMRYVELDLDPGNAGLPIKKIGIGPGFVGNQEVYAVEALCSATGYQPEIYFADTPYRRA